MNEQKGFSIIELLIALAIFAIVTAIAIPSYTSFMNEARRADAIAMLTEVAGEQQRFLSEQNRYAVDMTEMGYPADPMTSAEGYYSISVANPTPTSFVLTAARVVGEAQEDDAECGDFTLNSGGVKGAAGGVDCW